MSIYKKLFEAKKEIGTLTKDAKNPFFKSNYLSLNGLIDAVENVLVKHDLILLQPIKDGCVVTMIIDSTVETADHVSTVVSSMALPNIQDPQKLGSAITYYRRYTLQSLLGLQAEDDDGNSATKHVNKPRAEKDIPKPKRLSKAQLDLVPQSMELESLKTVLKTYSLSDNEKKIVNARIKILEK